jgi:phenylalanyl-tRNA synthetase beta chain
VAGPVVIGRVWSIATELHSNGKTIRWCQVDVGESERRGIVCGAHNFVVGDLVAVALPGAVLPGGFTITARKTYGHVSDGMICSARELGIGDDHTGILVLSPDAGPPGSDALTALGMRDAVLDIAVTPDRGYCLSVRGLAREAAAAFDAPFHDVADRVTIPTADAPAYPVVVDDPVGCDRFSARVLTGLNPTAQSPQWMRARLIGAGMRPISLAVDVTNYVMLETGQPLHAFDRSKLTGPIGVRRAQPGEKLTTLDGTVRGLDPDDLVVTDDTGPIALAGVMGGASTEIDPGTTDIVLEAAHWEPTSIARAVRRHKLPSEAAKRFERGVDPEVAAVAVAALRGPAGPARWRRGRSRLHRRRSWTGTRRDRAPGREPWPGRWTPDRRADGPAATRPGGLHRARCRCTHGHAAELAARPDRSGRPRRGGRAPGGLRPHPVGAAYSAARSRAVR